MDEGGWKEFTYALPSVRSEFCYICMVMIRKFHFSDTNLLSHDLFSLGH